MPTANKVMRPQQAQPMVNTAKRAGNTCAFQRASPNTAATAKQAATNASCVSNGTDGGCSANNKPPRKHVMPPTVKKRRVIAKSIASARAEAEKEAVAVAVFKTTGGVDYRG